MNSPNPLNHSLRQAVSVRSVVFDLWRRYLGNVTELGTNMADGMHLSRWERFAPIKSCCLVGVCSGGRGAGQRDRTWHLHGWRRMQLSQRVDPISSNFDAPVPDPAPDCHAACSDAPQLFILMLQADPRPHSRPLHHSNRFGQYLYADILIYNFRRLALQAMGDLLLEAEVEGVAFPRPGG
jgi:hypothetical protein